MSHTLDEKQQTNCLEKDNVAIQLNNNGNHDIQSPQFFKVLIKSVFFFYVEENQIMEGSCSQGNLNIYLLSLSQSQ